MTLQRICVIEQLLAAKLRLADALFISRRGPPRVAPSCSSLLPIWKLRSVSQAMPLVSAALALPACCGRVRSPTALIDVASPSAAVLATAGLAAALPCRMLRRRRRARTSAAAPLRGRLPRQH